MSKDDESEGDAMSAASLVLGYLNQGVQYYSEQASVMIPIADMAPEHAANAAERILREAAHWAQESGRGLGNRPFTWISERPLMVALRERSHAKPVYATAASGPWRCTDCTFAAAFHGLMIAHMNSTGHATEYR